MDKSITDNAVEQIAVNPDQTAQVVENSDKFENKAQLLQAVFDPNVVTQKSNKSLDDMTEWQRFIHDPWVAYESNDPRFDRFKPFADLSRDPEWYSLAQKYGKDLVFKTDTILGYTQPARTGLGRFIEGYNYAADSLRLADRESQLSDARMAGNSGLANQLENEIAELKFRMANDETPLQSKSWSSVADISASSLRNMPEILAINLIAGSLAAPTGGVSLVAGRGAVAATIYGDTFNIEFGSLLREIMEKNPGMAEADAREMATKGARVNALIEALPSLIPGLDVTAGIGKRAAQTVLGKVTKKALAQAAKANPTGFRKWLAEAFKILGEYGVEVGSESVQEVLQEISGQSAVRAATEGGDFYKISEDRLINFITDPFGEQNQDLWDVFGYTSLGSGVLEGVTGLVFGGAGRARRLGRIGNRNRQTLEQQAMGGAMNRTLADQLFQQRQNSEAPSQLQAEANKRMQARGIAPETVRIDKETAQALAIDPEVADAMRELGIQAALAESEDNGGVVEVDFTKYDDVVNTNKELFQKIRDAVSFSPETVSFAEFQRYIKMLDAKTIGEMERARQDAESVYNRILTLAKQAGLDEQLAESYAVMAQLNANRIGTFRMGQVVSGEEAARQLEVRWSNVTRPVTEAAEINESAERVRALKPNETYEYTEGGKKYRATNYGNTSIERLNKNGKAVSVITVTPNNEVEDIRVYDKPNQGKHYASSVLYEAERILGPLQAHPEVNQRAQDFWRNVGFTKLNKKTGLMQRPVAKKEKELIAGMFKHEGDKLVITLTPNANATTFIHELFHWFADELETAYNSGEMTDYWKGKVEDLAKMVGAKIKNGKIRLTDAQEEKAADMFLDYITEGKVQNREVKPLFAYLQNVFKGIYKVANKHLSPEAMELFDSIFRAQDVIEDEHRIVGLIPINKPENADQGLYDMYTGEMLNSRVRATQELHKTWAGIEKYQQSKEYEQKRNEVRLEVAQELNQETRYIVVDEYNKQNKDAAATWLALQTNPETQDLDLSLEQIADIVENTPDKTTEIDRITNQRMNELVMKKYNISPEEFGLRESRNTSKVRALLAEAMMREGKTVADFDTEYSQLLEKADKQVAKSSLNRLADKQYWNNLEARIVERYAYALSQGDQKAMAEARRDQAIVNAIRMRAESIVNRAKRFKEQAEKFRGAQPKVSYQLNGEKVYEHKYAAKDYDLLQSILEKFGFSVNYARRKPIPVGQKLDEWIDEQEATTITRAGELRNFISFINEGFDGEFQYMTGADFEKLESVFNAVKSVSGAKFSIILTNDKILLSSLVASTAKNMNDMGLKPFKKKDNYWARTFGTFGKFTNPEAIVRKLFPQDVLNKVWLPFIDAGVKAERYTNDWINTYRAAKGKVKLDNSAKTYSTGQTLTNKQVADLLLSMGNQHAYDNMRLSLGVYLGGELTETQAEAIVSEALQDQPALAEFANEVWAIYGKATEQLDKEFEERTNTLFVEKDHRSFEINGIKFGGGYVPVRKELDYLPTDPRAVNQGGMVHDKKFEKLVTKAPDGNMRSIVDITENELSQSARQGFTAVEYNNARKYLLADGTKAAIGERAFAFLRDWLTSYMMPKYDTTGWVRPFATVTTIGALGFRLSTALLQLSGLGPACATLGPTYFARGIAMAFRNNEWVPVLATKRGAKKSDYMLVRIGDPRSSLLGQSITDAVRSTDANTKAGKYAKVAFGKAGQAAMGLIQQVDTIVANITWNGAYLKALDAGMSEEEARREADSVVRTVQSDSLEVSRSVAMQGPMARMVTAFATWIVAMQSMLRAQIATRRYGEAALWAAMYMFISPVFESFLKEATKIGGGDDDKDYLERVLDTCYNEAASTMGNTILPFAGLGGAGLTAILEGAWEGITDEKGPFDMRQANVPALQAAGRAFSAARYTLAGKMDKAAYYGASTFSMEMGRLVKYLLAE